MKWGDATKPLPIPLCPFLTAPRSPPKPPACAAPPHSSSPTEHRPPCPPRPPGAWNVADPVAHPSASCPTSVDTPRRSTPPAPASANTARQYPRFSRPTSSPTPRASTASDGCRPISHPCSRLPPPCSRARELRLPRRPLPRLPALAARLYRRLDLVPQRRVGLFRRLRHRALQPGNAERAIPVSARLLGSRLLRPRLFR